MLFLAAALTLATPAPPRPAGAHLQATVSIQILTGARLHVGADRSEDGEPVHDAEIRAPDGMHRLARLVEFE